MKHFCFDIETTPFDWDVLQMVIPPFNEEDVKVGNYGPEKAREKIEKLRKEHLERAFRKAALSALTGSVAAIGIIGPTEEDKEIYWKLPEPDLLELFFEFYLREKKGGATWCGFNIASFDIPFMVRRAWALNIPVPFKFVSGRYLRSDFVDLAEVWRLSDRDPHTSLISLGELARFLVVGDKADLASQFHELLRYDSDSAIDYLINDLVLTWKIAHRLKAFPSQPAAPTSNGQPVQSFPLSEPVIRFW